MKVVEDFRLKVLCAPPSLEILQEAEFLAASMPDEDIPIWVLILANANPAVCADAIDEARRWMVAERLNPQPTNGNAKGQSITEFAIILVFLAIAALLLSSLLGPAFAAMGQMAQDAAQQLGATVDQGTSHAIERHGTQALAVYDCLSRKGAYQTWTNPTTGRRANLCQTEDGKWGAQIVDAADREITAFVNRCKEFGDFAQYLRNAGYIPPQ